MNDISIIILAAGNGTRMKSSKSKVLHELCGEPMITHILKKSYEITSDVRVVLSYQFEEVKSVVLAEFENTKICKQDTVNFPGTAGALRAAINDLNSKKTLIICGDMPLVQVNELKALCENSSDVTLSAFKAIDPNGYGRVITKDKKVVKIVEQKDANEDEIKVDLCNAGAYCFDTNLLKDLIPLIKNNNASKEFYLTDAIELAINRGFSVSFSLVSEANFMGINDKFALSLAEEIMQNSIKEKLMKNGVIMHLPKTIFIDSRAKF
ncbi:MAG: NTP transferase domain-containing protein, partial [Campylobacter hyointestinalis]